MPSTVEQLRAAKALSATQVQILQHSLGLTYGGAMYRNHFCTGKDSIDYSDCIALVAAGYMTVRKGSPITGGDDVFYVTDAGKDLCRVIADAEQAEAQDA